MVLQFLRRKWQPTPIFLPRESHGQWSLASYNPQGRKELDTTERLHDGPLNQLFTLKLQACSLPAFWNHQTPPMTLPTKHYWVSLVFLTHYPSSLQRAFPMMFLQTKMFSQGSLYFKSQFKYQFPREVSPYLPVKATFLFLTVLTSLYLYIHCLCN